jgi:hypothetical protein
MAQHSASSERGNVGLATRVSQSPPAGLICGGTAILVMVAALAGALPRPMFFVGAAALVAVAYTLDKRFKATGPPGSPAAVPPSSPATASAAPPVAATPAAGTPVAAAPSAAVPQVAPSTPAPSLLPIGDLRAEHTRLTRDLTDRVDDDEDVRFEKFMRLRRIEEEIERQQGAPPV